jgi:hypothetical protein
LAAPVTARGHIYIATVIRIISVIHVAITQPAVAIATQTAVIAIVETIVEAEAITTVAATVAIAPWARPRVAET